MMMKTPIGRWLLTIGLGTLAWHAGVLLAHAEPVAAAQTPTASVPDELTLSLNERYLNVAVGNQLKGPNQSGSKSKKISFQLRVNGHSLGSYWADLRHTPNDFVYVDLQPFVGPNATVTIRGSAADSSRMTIHAQPLGNAPKHMIARTASKAFEPDGVKMIHTPSQGKMWDPSLMWHDGWYYLYAMHNADDEDTTSDDNGMWGARSRDGVHWQELGPVIADAPFKVWKMFVMHNGEHFIAAHGSFSNQPGHENDTQRHWKSVDGVNWQYLGEATDTHPDPRWYRTDRRWDCMYMIPNEQGEGWLGYTVAITKAGKHGLGRLKSADGINWTVLPPVKFDSQGVKGGFAEFVGVEKINDRYYTIAGKRPQEYGCHLYSVFTYVSDSPDGPFSPDKPAFRLCGGVGVSTPPQWLAAMGRGKDNEILITNYVGTKGWGPDVTLLPIKKAVVDEAGHLRQAYWPNNEAAKGPEVDIADNHSLPTKSTWQTAALDPTFDLQQGIILEGTITTQAISEDAFAGFYLGQEKENHNAAIVLGIGKQASEKSANGLMRNFGGVNHFDPVDDLAGPEDLRRAGLGVANVTGLADNQPHHFRLWIRQGLMELYLDDLAVQTFFTGNTNGKLGLLTKNATTKISNLRCWQMDLEE